MGVKSLSLTPVKSPPLPMDRRLEEQQKEHEDSEYQYSLFHLHLHFKVSVIKSIHMLILSF
jgi:hypothetical protein